MVTRQTAVWSVGALLHHPHGHFHRVWSDVCALAYLQGKRTTTWDAGHIAEWSDTLSLLLALALHRSRQDRQYYATYYLSVLCIYGKSSLLNLLQFRYSLPLKSVGVNSPLTSSILVGVASQFWLRRYHPGWYRKYNYILGGALDGGAQVMIFVLSFAVFGASGVSRPFPTVSSQMIFLVTDT